MGKLRLAHLAGTTSPEDQMTVSELAIGSGVGVGATDGA
jgi:hypothetical protein